MSSRAMRKLHGRGDIMGIAVTNEEEEASSEEESSLTFQNQSANKFALLIDSDGVQSEEDEQEQATAVPSVTAAQSKKKKRNRKKKNKQKQLPQKTNDTISEDIDKLLDKIDTCKASTSAVLSSTNLLHDKPLRSVLTVEHRLLDPDNELMKIFGTRALMVDSSFRRRRQVKNTKGLWLTKPQSNWAKVGRIGLSMQLLQSKNGVQYFKYEHSKDYQNVQFKFLDAVDSSDHRNIASVIEEHTYHVDAFITFSDVYKVHDDLKMARELIERALYCLEHSFHSCFNLTTGACRLDYKYQENRSIFLAMYRHMNFVAQRGCNRTALELAKVLLSFDPDADPLGIILLLDNFALRSAEYEFLIRFANEWGANRNLSQLPNWAFSLAFAEHELDQTSSKADSLLQDALIMFPSVLLTLLDKCSVQPDATVSSHPYFTSDAKESTPDGLALLCHLFVDRNFVLWKDTKVLAWLESNVKKVLERVDEKEKIVEACKAMRKMRYNKPPLNIYRHAMMSEVKGIASYLPLDIRHATMLSHDPLPPPDTITSYERQRRNQSAGRRVNPFSLFLNSLAPGFNPEDAQHLAHAVDYDREQQGNAAQMRGNVEALMNAMRDLLHTFQEPDGEEEVEFDEEWD